MAYVEILLHYTLITIQIFRRVMLMICVHAYDKYYFPDNEEIKSTTVKPGDSYTYIDNLCTSIRVNTTFI